MNTIKIKLSFMMFLEFFIWGGWFVTMGTFLSQSFKASGSQLAMAYETQSIGAIIAPFIIGLIADRYFSAQKINLRANMKTSEINFRTSKKYLRESKKHICSIVYQTKMLI